MEACVTPSAWAALSIAVLVMSGEVAYDFTMKGSVTPEKASTYEFAVDITNRVYNASLLKPDSADYQILASQVTGMLFSIYGCATCSTHSFYQEVSAMTFSNETGTVLVKATLVFQSNRTSADEIRDLFTKATGASDEINGLKINPAFTQVIAPSTAAPPVSSSSHPTKTPTKTPTNTPSHPTIHLTTKHHNAASSFNQSPIASFLRYSLSSCLLLLISCSF